MHKTIMIFCLLAAVACGTAGAQSRNDKEDKGAKQRTERMATQVAKNLKLDDETAEWFKPVYVEMQDSLRNIRRNARADRKQLSKDNAPTEEEAAQLIEENFEAAEKETAVKRVYYSKLRERLTAVQLLQIFARPALPGGRNTTRPDRNRFPGGGPGDFPGGGFPGNGDF